MQWAFAGINRARSIQLKLRQRIELFFSSLRDDDAATSSNIARRPVKFRYSRYLFHDPPALSAFTLIFSVGRAVRTPVLARHRRVRRASPTRLSDFERRRFSIRCHFHVATRANHALPFTPTLEASASWRDSASGLPASLVVLMPFLSTRSWLFLPLSDCLSFICLSLSELYSGHHRQRASGRIYLFVLALSDPCNELSRHKQGRRSICLAPLNEFSLLYIGCSDRAPDFVQFCARPGQI